ncbi:hypothetical protein GWK47_026301 [Chionoecetes opilio]|uniref:Uncharacterized protein n=1 Tax=Chionoecetes opilio TaxID=41210 RepID=A0A8J8WMT3_CHIOP|nr:hypothetical protein GWK47_026301 [Chionoecetes opilio]
MLKMSWEVILGPRQRLPAVLVSGPPAFRERETTGSTSDRQLNRNGSGRASMDLLEAWGLTGVITALFLTQRPATVEYIGELPSFLGQKLDRKVFYPGLQHHILEVLGLGCMGEICLARSRAQRILGSSTLRTFGQILPHNPTNPVIRQNG